jgi:hypothetical protein
VSFEDDIMKMQLENASDIISESDYGTHTLIVYQNLNILREFYSYYVKKRIEEKNDVIQIAPFYETEDSVRNSLSDGEISIDIEKWEKEEKSLIIIDSLKKYSDNDTPESDNNFNKNLVESAKTMGKAGVSILTDIGAFPYKYREEELVNYELALPLKYDIDLKRVCLYHQKDFDKLSDDQKQKLVDHHGISIKI